MTYWLLFIDIHTLADTLGSRNWFYIIVDEVQGNYSPRFPRIT